MEKSKKLISKYKNYNNIEVYEDIVIKTFLSKDRFRRELLFHNLFSNYFLTPKIIRTDNTKAEVVYERIEGTTLNHLKALEKVDGKRLFMLREAIPRFKSKTRYNILFSFIPQQIIDGSLVHGDLRTANIILQKRTGDLYLIDFELGNYAFRELDDAYMYMSLSVVDKSKAEVYLDLFLGNNYNGVNLLYGIRYFMKGLMQNRFIGGNIINEYKKIEINLEKKLYIKQQHFLRQ